MRDDPREPEAEPLSGDRRRRLLALARRALAGHLQGGPGGVPPVDDPALLRPRAAFVTLRRADTGELRGCKGEPTPRRPLAESVVAGAIGAATDDPRFRPVTAAELPAIRIEVSALTPPRPIRPERVELGRHGLLIVAGRRRGLLLPQVPLHHGLDVEGYLEALCRKAGLPPGAWRGGPPGVELLGFEAEVWGEDGPAAGD